MRSATKIMLGIDFATSAIVGILSFLMAIIIAIVPQFFVDQAAVEEFGLANAYYASLFFTILFAISVVSAIAEIHAINKMDSASKKAQLIPSIIVLFITLHFISAGFLSFTPKQKILSNHPYFE